MTDREIVHGLIARNNDITKLFFFEKCRPLFYSVIRMIFSYKVDYNEFVNELYQYLMENDASKLRQFEFRSSIYQWLKILAIRYFIRKRDEIIEDESKEQLFNIEKTDETELASNTIKIDLEKFFQLMENKRYVFVIQKLILEEVQPDILAKSMNITTANLYNIKKRALATLTRVALNETISYDKR